MGWGRRIARAREAKQISQAQLGLLINAAQQTIAGYETEAAEPALAVFERMAKVLDTTPEWLAFGVGDGRSNRRD